MAYHVFKTLTGLGAPPSSIYYRLKADRTLVSFSASESLDKAKNTMLKDISVLIF